MRFRRVICTACLAAITLATGSFAERAPEDRKKATHVAVGTVQGVYVREEQGTRHYIVEVAVEKVEKGDGLKPGESWYVGCYLWNPDYYKGKTLSEAERKRLVFRGAAYDGVPKEGERIRVYAKHGWGKYAGIYPDWYDVVKRK
jgi:hypothetical protein